MSSFSVLSSAFMNLTCVVFRFGINSETTSVLYVRGKILPYERNPFQGRCEHKTQKLADINLYP